MRAWIFLRESWGGRDFFGLGLAAAVLLIAGWLVSLPLSPFTQKTTAERFHLRTGSFAGWALQQPVPPMYNLENRYWFARRPLSAEELTDSPPADVESMVVNHYPVRVATFADTRLRLFGTAPEGWLYVRSVYQQMELTSGFHVSRAGDGELRLRRLEDLP